MTDDIMGVDLDLRGALRTTGAQIARLPEQTARGISVTPDGEPSPTVFALVLSGDTYSMPVEMLQAALFNVEQLGELLARIMQAALDQPAPVREAFMAAYGTALARGAHTCGPDCAQDAHGTPAPDAAGRFADCGHDSRTGHLCTRPKGHEGLHDNPDSPAKWTDPIPVAQLVEAGQCERAACALRHVRHQHIGNLQGT